MKTIQIIPLIISFVVIISSCEKKVEPINNEIVHKTISKTITNGQVDSVFSVFGYILFEINEIQEDENHVIIKTPYVSPDIEGNGIIKCITYDNSLDEVNTLEKDYIISNDENWSSMSDGLSLDYFAGKGQKIIGLRYSNSSNGPGHDLFFGWIKVELSENMQELVIIDNAKNLTVDISIKAGQIE